MPLEIAAFNIASAIIAVQAGADRIEFCTNASLGGTTPSISDFKALKQTLRSMPGMASTTPIYIMIRSRGGDFVYSTEEVERMEREMGEFMALTVEEGRVDGFVFGLLKDDGKVDSGNCERLLELARKGSRSCTFHRAFDEILPEKRVEALEEIMGLGFGAVLTSGGATNAVGGKDVLGELVRRVRGRGFEIIVGGGVRSGNVEGLREGVGARWWHSSADVKGEGETDGKEVRRLVEIVGSRS
ncbi:Copper homeostasis protein cutC [Venturia nashicola]|nr:Copper homeostasis protein cutC [Venturia nashicola]